MIINYGKERNNPQSEKATSFVCVAYVEPGRPLPSGHEQSLAKPKLNTKGSNVLAYEEPGRPLPSAITGKA